MHKDEFSPCPGTTLCPFDSFSITHARRSHGYVWLSALLSAIPHPWEINRGSGIGAWANWALLSLFSYCCQERFVIAAPGSHRGTWSVGGDGQWSDRACGCHMEGGCMWLSDLVKSSTHRKGTANCIYIRGAHQLVAGMYFRVWSASTLLATSPVFHPFPNVPLLIFNLAYLREHPGCCWVTAEVGLSHFMLAWLLCVHMQGNCGRPFRRPVDGIVRALWAMYWHHKQGALPHSSEINNVGEI